MPQVINTNVLSLNAQRNLNTSGSQLSTSLQRLSSGLRINSAKDDAAGLAISERFTAQIRGLTAETDAAGTRRGSAATQARSDRLPSRATRDSRSRFSARQ